MNDFEEMCKILDKGGCPMTNICIKNKYLCAKKVVEMYAGDDRNKLLCLQSQAKGGDYMKHLSIIIAVTAMATSLLSLAYTVFESKSIGIILIVILIIVMIFFIAFSVKYSCINKWRQYIITATEEKLK